MQSITKFTIVKVPLYAFLMIKAVDICLCLANEIIFAVVPCFQMFVFLIKRFP